MFEAHSSFSSARPELVLLPAGSGADADQIRTVGVEEELMLVDPASGGLVPRGNEVVGNARAVFQGEPESWPGPSIKPEFFLEQVESATRPCSNLADLEADVREGRRLINASAAAERVSAVAMPTPVVQQPLGHVTPRPRYQDIHEAYGMVAHESLICAMHIHVGVQDEHEGVAVLDRVRPWIPLLVALSANSPFWRGQVTGHDSWRWQVWRRWPSTGPAEPFGDAPTYHAVARQILSTGAAQDPALLNYEVRLSARYPTVEFRVTDVCTDVEDAIVIAGLTRALVQTAAASWHRGVPAPPWRSDVLRAASWRAARSGLSHDLFDPASGELVDAVAVVASALRNTRRSLNAAGDLDRVRAGLKRIITSGNGAERQRRVHAAKDLRAVVADLRRRTLGPD